MKSNGYGVLKWLSTLKISYMYVVMAEILIVPIILYIFSNGQIKHIHNILIELLLLAALLVIILLGVNFDKFHSHAIYAYFLVLANIILVGVILYFFFDLYYIELITIVATGINILMFFVTSIFETKMIIKV